MFFCTNIVALLFIFLNPSISVLIKNGKKPLKIGSDVQDFKMVKEGDGYYFINDEGGFLSNDGDKLAVTPKPSQFKVEEKMPKRFKLTTDGRCAERVGDEMRLTDCDEKAEQQFGFEGDCELCEPGNDTKKKDDAGKKDDAKKKVNALKDEVKRSKLSESPPEPLETVSDNEVLPVNESDSSVDESNDYDNREDQKIDGKENEYLKINRKVIDNKGKVRDPKDKGRDLERENKKLKKENEKLEDENIKLKKEEVVLKKENKKLKKYKKLKNKEKREEKITPPKPVFDYNTPIDIEDDKLKKYVPKNIKQTALKPDQGMTREELENEIGDDLSGFIEKVSSSDEEGRKNFLKKRGKKVKVKNVNPRKPKLLENNGEIKDNDEDEKTKRQKKEKRRKEEKEKKRKEEMDKEKNGGKSNKRLEEKDYQEGSDNKKEIAPNQGIRENNENKRKNTDLRKKRLGNLDDDNEGKSAKKKFPNFHEDLGAGKDGEKEKYGGRIAEKDNDVDKSFDRGVGQGQDADKRMGRGEGQGMGRGDGQGMGRGDGQGMGRGDGQGMEQGVGQGMGDGYGQGMGRGDGQGMGRGEGQGMGRGDGQGMGGGYGKGGIEGTGRGMDLYINGAKNMGFSGDMERGLGRGYGMGGDKYGENINSLDDSDHGVGRSRHKGIANVINEDSIEDEDDHLGDEDNVYNNLRRKGIADEHINRYGSEYNAHGNNLHNARGFNGYNTHLNGRNGNGMFGQNVYENRIGHESLARKIGIYKKLGIIKKKPYGSNNDKIIIRGRQSSPYNRQEHNIVSNPIMDDRNGSEVINKGGFPVLRTKRKKRIVEC